MTIIIDRIKERIQKRSKRVKTKRDLPSLPPEIKPRTPASINTSPPIIPSP